MALDYVLENEDEHYLVSEQNACASSAKCAAFTRSICSRTIIAFILAAFPIAAYRQNATATSLVRFVFIDEGLLSMGSSSASLRTWHQLCARLGTSR